MSYKKKYQYDFVPLCIVNKLTIQYNTLRRIRSRIMIVENTIPPVFVFPSYHVHMASAFVKSEGLRSILLWMGAPFENIMHVFAVFFYPR